MTSLALFVGLSCALIFLSRRIGADRSLYKPVGWAAGLRLAAALFLYLASLYKWPIFSAQQHPVPGFWYFAMDSVASHDYAVRILSSWKTGVPYPVFTHGAIEYYILLAGIYRLFGPNPLNGILINVFISSLQVLLAYRIVHHLSGKRTALLASWLVALWPSSILWSTQLLKDSSCGLLALGVLASGITLWRQVTAQNRVSFLNRLSWWLILFISTAAITKLRSYLGIAMALSMLLAFGSAFLWNLSRRQFRPARIALGIATISTFAMAFAYQTPYPQRWFIIVYTEPPPLPEPKKQEKALEQEHWLLSEDSFSIEMVLEKLMQEEAKEKLKHVKAKKPFKLHQLLLVAMPSKTIIESSSEKALSAGAANSQKAARQETRQEVGQETKHVKARKPFKLRQLLVVAIPPKTIIERSSKEALSDGATDSQILKITDKRVRRVWIVNPKFIELSKPKNQESGRVIGESAVPFSTKEPFSWKGIGLQIWPTSHVRDIVRTFRGMKHRTFFSHPDKLTVQSADFVVWDISLTEEPDGEINHRGMANPELITVFNPQVIMVEQQGSTGNLRILHRSLYDRYTYEWGILPSEIWPLLPLRPISSLFLPHLQAIGRSFAGQASLQSLMNVRRGILGEGGHSVLYPEVIFRKPEDLVRFTPRALLVAWFAPFPLQWFDREATTGVFRIFGSVETLLFYLLLPWILRGGWRLLRKGETVSWSLLGFILLSSILLGLVIPNAGTLFRLRLPMILACLLLFPLGILPRNSDAKT